MTEEKNSRPSSVSPGRPGSTLFPTNPLGETVSYTHLTLPTTSPV